MKILRLTAISLILTAAILNPVHAAKRPNIIIMMTDNLGYGDLGVYGGVRAPTPRIDALARSGIQFRDFQVEPACSPSRAALMTGRMAIRSGTDAVVEIGSPSGLHPKEVTLAELLKRVGYKTAHYGKWHLGFAHDRQPQMQGFDDFWGILFTSAPGIPGDSNFEALGVPVQPVLTAKAGEKARQVGEMTMEYRGLIDREITDKAVTYIQTQARSGDPFFLYLPFINPHHPVVPHPDFHGQSGGGAYTDVLMEIDHNTGRILDAVEAAGIGEDTIIVWMSDNGPMRSGLEPYHNGDPGPWTGELGSVFEGSLRTAGMIKWPGTIEPFVSDEIFHEMDFYATLATWAGVEVPDDRPIDSIDQSEYLLDQGKGSKRDHVIVYYNNEYAALRYRHFKIMRAVYSRWDSLMSESMYLKSMPRVYNLRADPKEHFIIVAGPEALARSLVVREHQIRASYEQSFREYPNSDYRKMRDSH